MKTYVFGDIHGMYDKFMNVLEQLPLNKNDLIITLGDYIDRGPDSKKVIRKLMELKRKYKTVNLYGNHEDLLLNMSSLEI